MVRDLILRIAREIPDLDLCDPLDLFKQAISDASEVEAYNAFLLSLHEVFQDRELTSAEVRSAIFTDEFLERFCREISDSDPSLSVRSVAALMMKLKGVSHNCVKLTAKKRGGSNYWTVEVLKPMVDLKIAN